MAALILLGALPIPAYAWSNGIGGSTFGTHDWLIDQAARHARSEGYGWLNASVAEAASSDPDFRFHDFYYHVYEVGSHRYGGSPTRVAALYAETVAELRAGKRTQASRTFGWLAHYYADTCNPLHTDQIPAEKSVHESYERAVDVRTDVPGQRVGWIRYGKLPSRLDPYAFTVSAAYAAHREYFPLVSEYRRHHYDGAVQTITHRSLSHAANGLWVMLAEIDRAADKVPARRRARPRAATVAAASAASATPAGALVSAPVSAYSTPAAPAVPSRPVSGDWCGGPAMLAVLGAALSSSYYRRLRRSSRSSARCR